MENKRGTLVDECYACFRGYRALAQRDNYIATPDSVSFDEAIRLFSEFLAELVS
jgi:hypothetical protein